MGFSDLDVINQDGINSREADFYKAFSDVIDAIIKIKPNYIIHTGDLFHRASPSNRAITFALKEFKRLEHLKIPLIIIAGNHSTPKTHSSSPILEALSTIDNIYPIFLQKYEAVEFEDIIFHALPHINDERLIEQELDNIEQNISNSKKNILMMHSSVGAYYLMHEFGEWVYPKNREYLFEKMDYVALGHWHGFGAVGKHSNVYYSGSTERTSSSDKRDDKGYVIVELDKELKVSHHRIDLRKSLTFNIDASNYKEELEALDKGDIKGALVEVVIKNLDSSLSIDIKNSDIQDYFQDALYVKVKREFKQNSSELIDENIESISLEGHFIAHIQGSIKDRVEQTRLIDKTKELFAYIQESDSDS